MEVKKKGTISMYRLFLKHLVGLSLAIILVIMLFVILISISFQSGIVLQANYTDTKLNQLEDSLIEHFDKGLLPPYCSYFIVGKEGTIIDSNMSDRDINKAKASLLKGNKSYYDFYKKLRQDNGNIIIIKYDMLAHFSNPLLHKIIPYPELFVFIVLIGIIILFSFITALRFSKNLKKNLNSIIIATDKIRHQDLDFILVPTKILEFNTILDTIEKLKLSLSNSLKDQWNKEQQKKTQLSALAHDIKTPLTVIKGNAELLAENKLSKEDSELLSYIHSSADTIENYLELLMNVVNNNSIHINKQQLFLDDFIDSVSREAAPLCKTKNITFNVNKALHYDSIYADSELLKRAIINIVDNAVRYSDSQGKINLTISKTKDYIVFDITDYGTGFSEVSLKKATQEFFTEDPSRTNHHYGLGLNFAKAIADIHGGKLEIRNQSDGNGAIVSIKIEKRDMST